MAAIYTDRLQRVLNAACSSSSQRNSHVQPRLESRLTHLLHSTPSSIGRMFLDRRIQFKLAVTVRRCMQGNALQYLVDCCKRMTDVASGQRLRCISRHRLIVPLYQVRSSGVFCCRPDRLELDAARLSP